MYLCLNWFTCNYMNLFVNLLHMLFMLSPSMSTALLDIRQTFHLNIAITIVALISDWSVSAVHVILPCMMWLSHPSILLRQKLCMSFVLCVPSRVGIDPFKPRTHLHLLPLSKCWNLSYTFLDSLHQSQPCCRHSYPTCLYATSRSRHYLTTHYWYSYTKRSEV